MDKNIMKIYLDMDGVLTDFEKRYVEKFGEFPKEVDRRRKHFWSNWKKFVDDADFETLEKHKHADELLQAVRSLKLPVEILSSSGGGYSHEIVTDQKKVWLAKHGIDYVANIVPGGGHKAEFAGAWNILIDDTEHVIERYRKAGGTAIHHTDIATTIAQLHKLHLEWITGE
jgi:hypothetical protein